MGSRTKGTKRAKRGSLKRSVSKRKPLKRSVSKRRSSKRSVSSKRKRSVSKRRSVSPKGNRAPFKLYKSTVGKKKWDIYIPKGDKLKKVSFGHRDYEDYTIHKDPERRARYVSRHAKDRLNDPYSPGFWSMYVLWGKSSTLSVALKDAVRRAKRLL